MERITILGGEFNELQDSTKYADDNRTSFEDLIKIYDYLKDKKTEEVSFWGGKRTIEHAHLEFLEIALDRIYFAPKYNQATEDFLKSDYLSIELKKDIYDVLNDNISDNEILELLKSEELIKDFSNEQIKKINIFLQKTFEALSDNLCKDKCGRMLDLFESYIFVIDGKGPIEYIKEKYKNDLPIIILDKSGIPSHPSYYSGYGVDRRYLGEEHLFSIYKKIVKYYPDKENEFVQLVDNIFKLRPTEFVNNYLLFVKNGLNSNFKNNSSNISIDGVYGDTRDLVGIASIIQQNKSELFKEFEYDTNLSIKRDFYKMVENYQNEISNTKKLTKSNNN